METNPLDRREVVLHYIERLHMVMLATGESINRAYLLQCVFSTVTAFVSLGIASTESRISIGGLVIVVPSLVIVIGLSILWPQPSPIWWACRIIWGACAASSLTCTDLLDTPSHRVPREPHTPLNIPT